MCVYVCVFLKLSDVPKFFNSFQALAEVIAKIIQITNFHVFRINFDCNLFELVNIKPENATKRKMTSKTRKSGNEEPD